MEENLNCGDQKLLYSYFNRDGSNELGYSYAGRNYNTVSDFLLNQIAAANAGSEGRVCSNKNYFRVFNRDLGNYFRDETQAVTAPMRENFYCSKDGLAVDRIRLGCRITGKFLSNNLESF